MNAQAPFESQDIARLIERRLQSIRESIARELRDYPTPIPGCDVYFNRLLEDRTRVVDELQRLRHLREQAASDATMIEFARACEWLDQSEREQILQHASVLADRR